MCNNTYMISYTTIVTDQSVESSFWGCHLWGVFNGSYQANVWYKILFQMQQDQLLCESLSCSKDLWACPVSVVFKERPN